MNVRGNLNLDPFGQISADGTLRITRDGVVGGLQLATTIDVGPLTMLGAASFELNTTQAIQTIERRQFDLAQETLSDELEVVELAGAVRVFVGGKLKLTDSFVVQGSFLLENTPQAIRVDVMGSMNFFGSTLVVDAEANIVKGPNPGLVLKADASLDFGVDIGGFSVFDATLTCRSSSTPAPDPAATSLTWDFPAAASGSASWTRKSPF